MVAAGDAEVAFVAVVVVIASATAAVFGSAATQVELAFVTRSAERDMHLSSLGCTVRLAHVGSVWVVEAAADSLPFEPFLHCPPPFF